MKERWSRHENSDQYQAFLSYVKMPKPRSVTQLSRDLGYSTTSMWRWSKTYNWDERAAAHDKHMMQIELRESTLTQRQKHRQQIEEYRDAAQKQARDMMEVSQDLTNILSQRIKLADASDEEIPMALVAGLLRATANISEQGRQAWASAIGVEQLMEVVEVELQNADRERDQESLEGAESDDGYFEFELDD